MNPLVEKIAEAMGLELGDIQYKHGGKIRTNFGAEFFVSTPHYGRMGEVTPVWPVDSMGQPHYPYANIDIGFSLSKDPKKIGKDIETRFLPKLEPLWAEQQKIADEWSLSHAHKDLTMKIFCEAAGLNSRKWFYSKTGYCNGT
jgi:hypothetical protein